MFGAMTVKYAAGSNSFSAGLSVTIYGDKNKLRDVMFIDPYYFGLIVFGVIVVIFSMGNIENSKGL